MRYVNGNEIKEEFLFCEPLLETAKASDVFQKINNFFVKQNFDWKKKISSICMDGAPAMLGNKSGLAALVKKEAPNLTVIHCMLHRHALAAKSLPLTLKEILSYCVKIVNFIRTDSLIIVSSKLFVITWVRSRGAFVSFRSALAV